MGSSELLLISLQTNGNFTPMTRIITPYSIQRNCHANVPCVCLSPDSDISRFRWGLLMHNCGTGFRGELAQRIYNTGQQFDKRVNFRFSVAAS